MLLSIRHPNVVQFLGAVTQSSPMMIVTEYLPKVSIRNILRMLVPIVNDLMFFSAHEMSEYDGIIYYFVKSSSF